jgi:hypothetical protein
VETLRRQAVRETQERRRLPNGEEVSISALVVHFPVYRLGRLAPGTTYFHDPAKPLPRSYLIKPLVDVGGDPLFGELAVARHLEADGWSAVWVDSYHGHGKRLCWREMPDRATPYEFSDAPHAAHRYEEITKKNAGVGGWFDVFAWRGTEFLHVEYKGEGDTPNRNEPRWIMSALQCDVPLASLQFVLY